MVVSPTTMNVGRDDFLVKPANVKVVEISPS